MDTEHQHTEIQLPEGSWWDWEVIAWDAVRLRLAAGYDLTYHHGLELVFGGPAFVSCPAMFHDPVFRAPTAEESMRVARQLGEAPSPGQRLVPEVRPPGDRTNPRARSGCAR